MMLKANYFDGISSVPREVIIFFEGNLLSFEYTDVFGMQKRMSWQDSEVVHEKHTHGTHRKISLSSNELIFLELYDQDFSALDKWMKDQSVDSRKYALFMSRGLMVTFLIGIFALFPLIYFVGLPWLAGYAAENMPLKYEKQIGDEMSKSILASSSEQYERSAYADSFATCFAKKFEIPVKIHVLESSEVNAFALPGGTIIVNSAILDACKTKEEFAALLGHEIGHVQMRHSTKAVLRSIIGSIVMSFVVSDFDNIAGVAAEQANQLKELGFSRDLERDADDFGIKLMDTTGVDPQGMIRLFGILEKEEKEIGVEIPQFLSTHPLTGERIKTAKEKARELGKHKRENAQMEYYFQKLKAS